MQSRRGIASWARHIDQSATLRTLYCGTVDGVNTTPEPDGGEVRAGSEAVAAPAQSRWAGDGREGGPLGNAAFTIHLATRDDLHFLRAMLYEAAFWREPTPRPSLSTALADPHVARYVDRWGRVGDAGVVAVSADGTGVGAAWYRRFSADAPGYGFLDAATPELAVGVAADARNRGIGTALLTSLTDLAKADGIGALCLSVEDDNLARRLYERLGFRLVAAHNGAWTMRRTAPDLSHSHGSDALFKRGWAG